MACFDQQVECLARGPHAERRIPPAPDELLGLREKFDLANAAAPELDVVPGDGDLAAAAVGVDLALDGADVLDRGEVEVTAPDEGLEPLEEAVPRLDVAGYGLRLDHGGPLPVLAGGRVIGLGGADREGGRSGAGVGAEAEVGAEHVSVGRPLVHDRDEIAGKARKRLLQAVAAGVGHDLLVEEDDDVHVARIVELACAELAHAEDDETRAPFGLFRIGQGELAPIVQVTQQMGANGAERRRRDVGKRTRDPLQRPHRDDIGHADGEAGAALRDTKALHHLLPRFLAQGSGVRRHLAGGGVGGLRPLLDQQPRKRLVGDEAMAEVAAIAEQCAQQRIGGGVALARVGERDELAVLASGRVLAPALPAERARVLVCRQGRLRRVRPFRR